MQRDFPYNPSTHRHYLRPSVILLSPTMAPRTGCFLILGIVLAVSTMTCAAPVDTIGASQSPGAVSGNVVQVPVVAPINACGNTIDVIGVLNPTFGNNCKNEIENA
ncbi:small secreted domain-containing protein [Linnemannia elongata]|nr:small secreted domain-containing protein [Linnemannia elongata]